MTFSWHSNTQKTLARGIETVCCGWEDYGDDNVYLFGPSLLWQYYEWGGAMEATFTFSDQRFSWVPCFIGDADISATRDGAKGEDDIERIALLLLNELSYKDAFLWVMMQMYRGMLPQDAVDS